MVQEIYVLDSIYRIPISAIDSVAFVTPETIYKKDVAHTTESDLWSYVIGSDSVRTLLLKANTPTGILPKAGDKLVTTKSRDYLPGGFYAQVESVSNSDKGIIVNCKNVDFIELFDQFTAKARIWDDGNSQVRNRAGDGNGSDSFAEYIKNRYHKSLDEMENTWDLGLSYDLGNDWSISGSGKVTAGMRPAIRTEAILNVSWWTGTKFHTLLSIMADSWVDLELKASLGGQFDAKFGKVKMWIPDTPFCVDIEAGLSASLTGEVELKYDREDWTHAWLSAGYDSSASWVPYLNYKLTNQKKEEDFSLMGSLSATFGPYAEIDLSAVDNSIAKAGLRFDSGMKSQISSSIKLEDILTIAAPLPMLLYTLVNPTRVYDMLNRDGGIKFGRFGAGKFVASITSKWKAEKQLYDIYKGWDLEAGFVPKFSNVSVTYDEKTSLAKASADLSRQTIGFTPVGFAAFNKDGKKLGQKWYESSYYMIKNAKGEYEPNMKQYSIDMNFNEMGGNIRFYPIISMFDKYQMLASPYKEINIPVTLEVRPTEFKFDPIGGEREFTLTSNIDWNCENEKYVIDVDYGKIDWVKVKGTAPNMKLVVDKNPTTEERKGELLLKLTSPQNSKIKCEVKLKVEQKGQDKEEKKYMFLGSWFNGEGSVTNMVTFGEDGSYYFEQRTNDQLDFTRVGTYVVTRYKEYSENSSIRMEADVTETFVTSSTGKTNTKNFTLMLLSDDRLSYRNTYFWRSGF